MTLYRGVSAGHPDYPNAVNGMAVPSGLEGGHDDPDRHNAGDNDSIFTSWTMSRAVADYHASKDGSGGVVLSREFAPGETVPSPDNFAELEVLVPGVVTGARVEEPLGPGSPSAY